jgi:hypothetical protein
MNSHGSRASVAGVTLLVVLAAGGAVAHTRAAAPSPPAVGSWATYRWTSTVKETVPVIVQQTGPGGQVSWSVAQETTSPPPIFVTYALVRGDGQTYTLQIVTQNQPDGRPLSVTHVTVNRRTGKAVRSVIRSPKGVVATPESGLRPVREAAVAQGRREEVTVPAGRLTAVHGTAQGGEVWVSDQVSPLGLVKGVWPQGTLELAASGTGGARDMLKADAK